MVDFFAHTINIHKQTRRRLSHPPELHYVSVSVWIFFLPFSHESKDMVPEMDMLMSTAHIH